jgi:DNA-binding CsgD family transcriptional regulator
MERHSEQSTTEYPRLTPREREVLALAQRGLTNPAIAAELGITENAVRYHLKELHSKLETAGDRGRLNRIGWLAAGVFLRWKASAAPLAAAGFVVTASAAGFWAVRSAHESSADGRESTRVEKHCAALVVPTVIGAPGPGASAQQCFATAEELAAYYKSLP